MTAANYYARNPFTHIEFKATVVTQVKTSLRVISLDLLRLRYLLLLDVISELMRPASLLLPAPGTI